MKALHAVVICLIILAVLNYTTATLGPLIQQENNPLRKEPTFHNPRKGSPKEKPSVIILGDPIDNPKPH